MNNLNMHITFYSPTNTSKIHSVLIENKIMSNFQNLTLNILPSTYTQINYTGISASDIELKAIEMIAQEKGYSLSFNFADYNLQYIFTENNTTGNNSFL